MEEHVLILEGYYSGFNVKMLISISELIKKWEHFRLKRELRSDGGNG